VIANPDAFGSSPVDAAVALVGADERGEVERAVAVADVGVMKPDPAVKSI
jgi:hypothetical protein